MTRLVRRYRELSGTSGSAWLDQDDDRLRVGICPRECAVYPR